MPPPMRSPEDIDAANVARLTGSSVVQINDEFSQAAFGTGSVTVTTTMEDPLANVTATIHRPLPKNTRIASSLVQKAADRLRLKVNPDGTRRKVKHRKGGKGGGKGSGGKKKP